MLSSVLDPSKIVNQRKSSPESFQKFMSGGESPLGSSVVSSAANKIVGFSKVGVSPVTPDISSILNDISTSIISNVDNSIKNTTNFVINDVDRKIGALRSEIYGRLVDVESSINDLQSQTYSAISNVQQNVSLPPSVQSVSPVSDIPKVIENIQVQVQETLNTTLSNFSKDYQEKIKGIDDVKPKNVLDKFLDLYRNAIGFINFFSDRKNINRLTENLKSIRGVFDTTFNVAKILRETILKIVKQLTNLPSASVSSPGLDLDIKIPGGGLKQAAGPQASRVGKALRIGALGLGAVGLGVAGAEAAKRYQESQLYGQTESDRSGMPGNFIEMFSSIIDKFSNVIGNLIDGTGSLQNTTPSGGGGGGGGSPGGAPPSAPPGGGSPVLPQEGSPEEYRIAAALVTEGGSGLDATDILQVAANRIQSGKYRESYTDVFAQPGQFQGVFDRGIDNYKNIQTKEDAAKFAGVSTQEIDKRLSSIRDPSLRANSAEFVQGALEFRAAPSYYQERGLVRGEMDASGKFYDSKWRGTSGSNQFLTGPKDPKISTPAQINLSLSGQDSGNLKEPRVSTSPTQTQAMQATSRSISQPAQQVPTTVSLPPTIIDASSPQQQSSGSKSPTPQPSGAGSIEVPFLPTSNSNNFYVLYARSVYNVVDG
jgi:hypothetical protein